jgi:glycerophosphoryl diester phosphodiesterase
LSGIDARRRGTPTEVGVLIIAHRGASGSAPENTLAALRRAVELGAAWAEVDVQRTADGVLVLVHDDGWERTTGFHGAVAGTPWAVVRGLDAGSWFGPAFAGEPVPTLAATLEWARAAGLRLDLEIKSPEHHPGLGREIVAAVREHGMAGRVVLTCFDAELVEALAGEAPDLDWGYLAAAPVSHAHPSVHLYSLYHEVVDRAPALLASAHAAARRVFVWTVDDPARGASLAALGVDGLITNHPERFTGRSA